MTAAVDAWGDEGRRYDFHKGAFSESTGHFSQLVWKGTGSVGCGRVECAGEGGVLGWEVVCEYWPAGNVEGEFEKEVGREVQRWRVEGGGEAGRYVADLVGKMNGGGRMGGDWWLGVGMVGLGMWAGLGL